MEKIDRDCEGAESGYRCWAAGEQGFRDAAKDAAKEWILEDADRIVRDAMRSELQHIIDIETKTHGKHHEYIQSQIDRNNRDEERWEFIKRHVLGIAAVSFLGWIGKLIIDAILHYRGQP